MHRVRCLGSRDVFSSFFFFCVFHILINFFFVIYRFCYDFSYFALFTHVFSLFLEVSHGTAALTHFSLTHIAATLLTHSTATLV